MSDQGNQTKKKKKVSIYLKYSHAYEKSENELANPSVTIQLELGTARYTVYCSTVYEFSVSGKFSTIGKKTKKITRHGGTIQENEACEHPMWNKDDGRPCIHRKEGTQQTAVEFPES